MAALRRLLVCVSVSTAAATPANEFQPTFPGLAAFSASLCSEIPCTEHGEVYLNKVTVDGRTLQGFSDSATPLAWPQLHAALDEYMASWSTWVSWEARWPLEPDGAQEVRRTASGIVSSCTDEHSAPPPLLPHVVKVSLPANAEVAVFGDLHGAVHSFVRILRHLSSRGVLRDDLSISHTHTGRFFMLFLGDFVDRGFNGVEVLYLIALLRARNPNNVFVTRGNHEDGDMNAGEDRGAFAYELRRKFPHVSEEELHRVYALYETLPVAHVVGTSASDCVTGDAVLGVHGGIEIGFDLRPLLAAGCRRDEDSAEGAVMQAARIPSLMRHTWLMSPEQRPIRSLIRPQLHRLFHDIDGEKYPAGPVHVHPPLGYMWWDFLVDDTQSAMEYSDGRGFIFGLPSTDHWLRTNGIAGVLRAHQHNNARASGPMLSRIIKHHGIVDNWNGSHRVLTLLSGGFIPFLGFKRDSFGLWTLPSSYSQDWRMDHCSQPIGKPTELERPTGVSQFQCTTSIDQMSCTTLPWKPHHSRHGNASTARTGSSVTIDAHTATVN